MDAQGAALRPGHPVGDRPRETSVIFGAVLGTVVLKEGFGPRRIAAALLVTVGIALLAVMR